MEFWGAYKLLFLLFRWILNFSLTLGTRCSTDVYFEYKICILLLIIWNSSAVEQLRKPQKQQFVASLHQKQLYCQWWSALDLDFFSPLLSPVVFFLPAPRSDMTKHPVNLIYSNLLIWLKSVCPERLQHTFEYTFHCRPAMQMWNQM